MYSAHFQISDKKKKEKEESTIYQKKKKGHHLANVLHRQLRLT